MDVLVDPFGPMAACKPEVQQLGSVPWAPVVAMAGTAVMVVSVLVSFPPHLTLLQTQETG